MVRQDKSFTCIRRFTNVDGSSWSRRTVLMENQGIRFIIARTQLPMMSAGVLVSSTFFPSGDSTRTPATVTCVLFHINMFVSDSWTLMYVVHRKHIRSCEYATSLIIPCGVTH